MYQQIEATDTFSRERLAGYDPEVLCGATVLFAGAGALTQNTLTNVALPGVGEIRVVDFDEFEPHNAPLSVHYPTAVDERSWGLKKARIVAEKIRVLMTAEKPIVRYATTAIQSLGLGAFDGVDVIVAGVDNPRARAYLSDASRCLGLALIEAGFDGPYISMSCFPPTTDPDRPCYRCGNPGLTGTFSCQRYASAAARAGVIPAIQPAAATLGGLQAEAVIQALHGSYPTAFKRTALNIRTGESRQYELVANPGCEGLHHPLGTNIESLDVTSEDTLAVLVAAVEASVGRACSINLPEPFVIEAYCMTCGNVIRVEAPEWSYDAQPHCTNCSGPWTAIGAPPEGHSPTKPASLSRHTDEATLSFACKHAGLAPRAIFTAQSEDETCFGAFKMAGSIDDLYATIEPGPTCVL